MKKQVFKIMMMLALIVGAGTSALAQDRGNGMLPSTTLWIIEGTTVNFDVDDNATSTFLWEVYEFAFTDLNLGINVGLTNVGATKATIDTDDAYETDINFYDSPEAGNMFAVQCTETGANGCITIRRFYVSIFDFDVEVYLVDNIAGSNPEEDDDKDAICNSWSNKVVINEHSDAEVAAMDTTLQNNLTDLNYKVTDTYFRVDMTINDAPDGFDLQLLKWRFEFTFPSADDLVLHQISSVTSGPTFVSAAGNDYIEATDPQSALTLDGYDGSFAGNNSVYVPRTTAAGGTASYIFEVKTHNLLGQVDPMVYDVMIDHVAIEFDAVDGTYNNGQKVHFSHDAAGIATYDETGAQGQTGTRTIDQSPATTIIDITE